MFFAPDTYMEKIAIGPNLPKNLVDLDNSVEKNISLLALMGYLAGAATYILMQ